MPLRWGIIATGGISTEFAQDLLTDPSLRGSAESHVITHVGSRSIESAQRFIDTLASASSSDGWKWGVDQGLLGSTRACLYADVYAAADVDVVYVGTPPVQHYENCRDALNAGKHVLCEKPFTLDLAELDELIAIAKERGVFLMEAVWTRFHPLAAKVREIVASKRLGKPLRYGGDFSMDWKPDSQPVSHRMLDPALGGGGLLDMGPYPSVWAMLLVHNSPYNTDPAPQVINSHQTLYARTGVDLTSRWLVQWEGLCQGTLTTDLSAPGLREATAWVQCEEGDLVVEYPPYKAETFHVVPRPERFKGGIEEKETYYMPVVGCNGLAYEADHVAAQFREGRTESELMTHEESRVVQRWFDQVRTAGTTKTAGLKGGAKLSK